MRMSCRELLCDWPFVRSPVVGSGVPKLAECSSLFQYLQCLGVMVFSPDDDVVEVMGSEDQELLGKHLKGLKTVIG